MILAGDIGATRTRLAAFETEGNRATVRSRKRRTQAMTTEACRRF